MNILKIPFQYSIYTAKETPFRSEIMRYNDLEHERIEIKTLVILRMLFAYMSPEAIRTHRCSRIYGGPQGTPLSQRENTANKKKFLANINSTSKNHLPHTANKKETV